MLKLNLEMFEYWKGKKKKLSWKEEKNSVAVNYFTLLWNTGSQGNDQFFFNKALKKTSETCLLRSVLKGSVLF